MKETSFEDVLEEQRQKKIKEDKQRSQQNKQKRDQYKKKFELKKKKGICIALIYLTIALKFSVFISQLVRCSLYYICTSCHEFPKSLSKLTTKVSVRIEVKPKSQHLF